jgi:hypothetical protein
MKNIWLRGSYTGDDLKHRKIRFHYAFNCGNEPTHHRDGIYLFNFSQNKSEGSFENKKILHFQILFQ